jgi:hypothetical protein
LAGGYAIAGSSDVHAKTINVAKEGKKPLNLKEAYQDHQVAEAEKYFHELDAADQTAAIERYNAHQATPVLRLAKKASKGAQMAFYSWLGTETWGEPTTEDFLRFAERLLASA